MMLSLRGLFGFAVCTHAGHSVGKIADVLFDDNAWVVRHFVVRRSDWLTGDMSLFRPMDIDWIDIGRRAISLRISDEEFKSLPGVDADIPVSKQRILELRGECGWIGSACGVGYQALPSVPAIPAPEDHAELVALLSRSDAHCRSSRVITGYLAKVEQDCLGVVEAVMADDQSWHIPFLLIRGRRGRYRTKGLVRTSSISRISWSNRTVRVGCATPDVMHVVRSTHRGEAPTRTCQ